MQSKKTYTTAVGRERDDVAAAALDVVDDAHGAHVVGAGVDAALVDDH